MMHNLLLYTFLIPYIDYNSYHCIFLQNIYTYEGPFLREIFKNAKTKMLKDDVFMLATTTRPNPSSYTKMNLQPLK